MGRQSARLWHDGKDHKDLWKLIVDEENYFNNAWRMHWQIYKGNTLLWEKLPPNFLAVCIKSGRGGTANYWMSDDGKKFSNYGFAIDYREEERGIKLVSFCKIGQYIYSLYKGILYTDNLYSWKTMDVFETCGVKNILNYNERLLIVTEKELITYDTKNNKRKNLVGISDEYNFKNHEAYAFGNTLLVICHKKTVYERQYLLVFKDDELVKTFSDAVYENGYPKEWLIAGSIAGNGNTAYIIGNNKIFQGYGNRKTILSSKDGLTWKDELDDIAIGYDYIFCAKNSVYAYRGNFGEPINLYRLDSGELVKIDNNLNVGTQAINLSGGSAYIGNKGKVLAFEANGWMYANAYVKIGEEEKYYFIRFTDFEAEECEILSEQAFLGGIYIKNWEG